MSFLLLWEYFFLAMKKCFEPDFGWKVFPFKHFANLGIYKSIPKLKKLTIRNLRCSH